MAQDGVILVVAAILAAALLVWMLLEIRRLRGSARATPTAVAGLEAKVDALTTQLDARVGESAQATRSLTTLMHDQLAGANRSFTELAERLGRLDEATRQVERIGRSIAGLEQLLAAPKLRGRLGEWSLERLLREVLPEAQIALQHRLPSRDVVVDVAIRIGAGRLIAIDSKFPLEAFRRLTEAESNGEDADRRRRELHRAVRGRVEEIARKYISPEDGTLDFALMFIPSESLYYELAVRGEGTEFLDYSRERRVIPCSPNTLYAYLQAIMLGLRGQRIAEHARRIQATLDHLGQEVAEGRELLERAATQLRNASQNVDGAGNALGRAQLRLEGIGRLGDGAGTDDD